MSLHAQFLTQIRQFVRAQDSDSLRSWLQVHPNSSPSYYSLKEELVQAQRRGDNLDAVIDKFLPLDDDAADQGQASVWPGFQAFIKDYSTFWRDVDYGDLPGAHQLLGALVKYAPPPSLISLTSGSSTMLIRRCAALPIT